MPVERSVFVNDSVFRNTILVGSFVSDESGTHEIPLTSLFTGHELQVHNSAPLKKIVYAPSWITLLLIFCMMLIAYLRAVYPKRFADFFRAVSDIRFASQLVREERAFSNRLSILLLLVFLIATSGFIFQALNYFGITLFEGSSINIFFKIFGSVLLLFIFRMLLHEFTGFLFEAQNELTFYTFNVMVFNMALGIVLLPIIAGIVYADNFPKTFFIYAGLLIVVITYLARLIRGLNIGLSKQGFNRLYLFFYFCALEFLPVLFIAKLIINRGA